ESAPDLIVHANLDGKIRMSNRPLRGKTAAEAVGTGLFDGLSAEDEVGVRNAFDRVVQTGVPSEYECSGERADGRIGTFSVCLGAVRQDDRVVGVVAISRDITDRKLVPSVAHELNNPLAVVIAGLMTATRDIAALGGLVTLPPEL